MTGSGNADSRQPVPVETGQGLTVHYRNRWLYSRRAPGKNPALAAASLELKPETLVFCPSPLLGYGLPELIDKLPPQCTVLAVEADEELMAFSLPFIKAETIQDIRFRYIRTASVRRLLECIDTLPSAPFRRVVRLDLSGGTAIAADFYDHAFSALNEYISRWWKNRFTLMRLGRNYARNILTNLGLASKAKPFVIPRGKAIFLAAAGPSLESAIPLISAHRDVFFIAAVDTAARHLVDSGIRPDTIILVESQYWIDPAFQGICGSAIPLWADLTARTASIQRTSGPISFFVSEYAKTSLLKRLENYPHPPLLVPPLGSVGLTALHLLSELRAPGTPLFFAGLDFSWKQGYSHIRSAPAALTAFFSHDRLTPLAAQGSPGSGSAAKTHTETGAATSDRLLADYAEQAKALSARIAETGRGPCLNLGKAGLNIDFPKADEALLKSILKAFTERGLNDTQTCELGPAGLDGLNGSDMCAFLYDETERINRLEKLLQMECTDSETSTEKMDERLSEALSELDYLWLHFPDAARGFTTEEDFLRRTAAGIGYFKKSISRAFSFLSS